MRARQQAGEEYGDFETAARHFDGTRRGKNSERTERRYLTFIPGTAGSNFLPPSLRRRCDDTRAGLGRTVGVICIVAPLIVFTVKSWHVWIQVECVNCSGEFSPFHFGSTRRPVKQSKQFHFSGWTLKPYRYIIKLYYGRQHQTKFGMLRTNTCCRNRKMCLEDQKRRHKMYDT